MELRFEIDDFKFNPGHIIRRPNKRNDEGINFRVLKWTTDGSWRAINSTEGVNVGGSIGRGPVYSNEDTDTHAYYHMEILEHSFHDDAATSPWSCDPYMIMHKSQVERDCVLKTEEER